MFSAILLIIVLGLLVFIHEFGHFIIAKKSGMKVEEFGFGFPPRIWGYKPKNSETTYSINLIPLGGFVKIFGEDPSEQVDPNSPDSNRTFASKSVGARSFVLVAGVLMNFLLAVLLFGIINITGYRTDVSSLAEAGDVKDIHVAIGGIAKDSPAEVAGLKAYDYILSASYGSEKIIVNDIPDLQLFTKDHLGKEITLEILRNDKELNVSLTPRVNAPEGEGAIGVGMGLIGYVRHPWYGFLWYGLLDALNFGGKMIGGIVAMLGLLFSGVKGAGDGLAGPVGIAVILNDAFSVGMDFFVRWVALLSLNLAVLNILPIPPLDGGKLLFTILEKVRKGVPVPKKIEALVGTIGFFALIALVIFATYNDIGRFL